MTDATQPGVPNEETQAEPSARELAMDAIAAKNKEHLEAQHIAETGKSLFNNQIDAQLEAPTKEEKVESTPKTIDDEVVTVKIDGEERQVTVADMRRQYQKNGAAEKRLEEATRLLNEARAATPVRIDAADEEVKTKGSELPSDGGDTAKQLITALFEGDEEKAIEAVRGVLGRSDPTPNIAQLTAQLTPAIKQQLIVESALDKFSQDYKDIVSDPYLATMADGFLAEEQKDGQKSFAESLEAAGQKTRDWLKSKGVDTGQASPTIDRNEKLARKEGMDRIPALQTRATTTEEQPQTQSQVILEMQRARGLAV